MSYHLATINPHYADRMNQAITFKRNPPQATIPTKVQIGPATLYQRDCFDILPTLGKAEAVVTDPPFGIGFQYRSHNDAPRHYDLFMQRLVPALNLAAEGGPCFVWQSPLKADQWHRWFPKGFRIVAGCKQYPEHQSNDNRYAWDPIVFWSHRGWLRDELPCDWHVARLIEKDDCPGGNPHPCPRPLSQVRWICDNVRARSILDPFLGSGTTGVAAVLAGKQFVGIEPDTEYFQFACKRIERAWKFTTMRQKGTA